MSQYLKVVQLTVLNIVAEPERVVETISNLLILLIRNPRPIEGVALPTFPGLDSLTLFLAKL